MILILENLPSNKHHIEIGIHKNHHLKLIKIIQLMKIKKVILIILAILIVVGAGFALFKLGDNKKKDSSKKQVVASNFASYDFLRAIIGDNDNIELTFLLGPGKEAHSYDPTAKDLTTIQDADLFVYIGGEMEQWADKVLDSLDTNKS